MRVLTIASAYLIAALVGPVLVGAIDAFLMGGPTFGSAFGSLLMTAIVGGILVFPAAIMVIAITEDAKSGRWWVFVASGGLGALLLSLAFWRSLADPIELTLLSAFAIGAVSGLTYWFVAWRISPPNLWSLDDR